MATEINDEAGNIGEYTKDGTVDLHGNPILRGKRGGWKACSFIVVYEIFERMAYYGILSNLVLYMTNELHQGIVTASNNVTNWIGTIWIMPFFGAYIADAYLGRYWTFVISAIIYLSGLCLLTLAVSIPSLKPLPCGSGTTDPNCIIKASHLQLGVFFGGLYTIALGGGGTKPNISTIGADQFDKFHPKECEHKISFFNWWMFLIFLGALFANTFLAYIQENIGWTVGYLIPMLGLAISLMIFIIGSPFYRHKPRTKSSPFIRMAQVIVAALRKWRVHLPVNPMLLHELELQEYNDENFQIAYTPSLNFLSKAAMKTGQSNSPWALCTVTQVEETKQMLRMVPILIATFIPSTVLAQVGTLFIKQGVTLNRHIGPHFIIPPASLSAFVTISMLITIVLYDLVLVPFTRRLTGNPRGISLLQRMGIGCVIHTLIMFIASYIESHRLSIARANNISKSGEPIHMTIFILMPQFVLVGIADAFLEIAKIEFFYDQAPERMKSLGSSFAFITLGVGSFISSLLLKTIARVTERDGGRRGWILNNLNESHLDYYYAFLAFLCALNLIYFVVVSRYYVYKHEFVQEAYKEFADNTDIVDLNR